MEEAVKNKDKLLSFNQTIVGLKYFFSLFKHFHNIFCFNQTIVGLKFFPKGGIKENDFSVLIRL